MKKRILILVVVLLVAIPLLSSCIIQEPVKVRGGGWLPYYGEDIMDSQSREVIGVGKTNFGFTVNCYNAEYDMDSETWIFDVKGQFLYIDHVNGVRVKGPVLGASYLDGGGVLGGECTYNGMPAIFGVEVYDSGEPGTYDMFSIKIYYETEIVPVYINEGPLGGGNIQSFSLKPVPVP
ncbi:MAG: hypothetical protein KAH14_07790 [Clostridiales bacterium]|nr:hypothetical protein [Clostridiales bacterium]